MTPRQRENTISIPTLSDGVLAGLCATIPMTLTMEVMHRFLPAHERYPLPPREITEKLLAKAGVREQLNETEHVGLSLLSHFSYGAAAGVIYAALARNISPPPLPAGIAFGLGVWAISYLGLLPAAGILRPATKHPPRRNALMLTAHVVWGSVLGLLVDRCRGQH